MQVNKKIKIKNQRSRGMPKFKIKIKLTIKIIKILGKKIIIKSIFQKKK
jgi:hypothetical protein